MNILLPDVNRVFSSLRDAVFLAGPISHDGSGGDWRSDAISLFAKHGFTGDIINPVNDGYDGDYLRQIDWERRGLCLSSAILFWVPRSSRNPGFTTNIEFGEWMGSDGVVLGFPEGAPKTRYMAARFRGMGKDVHHSLEDAVLATIDLISNRHKFHGGNIFFTSDTHFSQQRTLELSYRPFVSVDEMDLHIASNWNKRLNSESVVYHLGDFGNFGLLPLLNFKRMVLVLGNYERDGKSGALPSDPRVRIVDDFVLRIGGRRVRLCHEPLYDGGSDADFHLFGHIHRLQMVKRNGVNVGIDGNRFHPMSLNELQFLIGGVVDHFDENVFVEECRRRE